MKMPGDILHCWLVKGRGLLTRPTKRDGHNLMLEKEELEEREEALERREDRVDRLAKTYEAMDPEVLEKLEAHQ